MAETCEKCGRPKSGKLHITNDECASWLPGTADVICFRMAEAFKRGLREGLAIAKAHAEGGVKYVGSGDYVGNIDWSAAENEIEKRCKGGER